MILLFFFTQGLFALQEQDVVKRVHNHLLIEDSQSAIREAQENLNHFPESKALRLALIQSLCHAGNEIEALVHWNRLSEKYDDLTHNRTALEMLSWGVLNKGGSSNQLNIKVNALIGASMTKDARAIPLILEALRGTNSLVRAVAVGLAAIYGDFPLQEEISRLLKVETVWQVRLELIKAVGQLRMQQTKEQLLSILANSKTLVEEKAAAIVSLVRMYDSVGDKELANLVRSDRAGLRELAAQIIYHLNLDDKVEMLLPLLKDAHPTVRISTLNTFALLQVKNVAGKPLLQTEEMHKLLNDSNPEVVITAGWLALLNEDKRGERILEKWILDKNVKYARLAAGALAISGKKAAALSLKLLKKSDNPYVQITLALGLIGQRQEIELACSVIDQHLSMGEKWMWDTSMNPLFRSVSPSKITHNTSIPNYPEVVSQLTRIELLQILCIMRYPKAELAMKEFLKNHTWGAVGAAAASLLQEGDEEALDIVRNLLKDPEEKVRIQAALILALLGGDKAAVEVLKAAYPHVNKEIKIHILEAIAKVADPSAISFLLERLNEPFQVLRVVAATGIIQCLYH